MDEAVKKGMYSRDNHKNYKRSAPGIRIRRNKGGAYEVRRRAYSPTLVNVASMLPSAIAINTGIGLLGGEDSGAFTGRTAGYQAALPSEDDPRQTSNAIAEVGWRCLGEKETFSRKGTSCWSVRT